MDRIFIFLLCFYFCSAKIKITKLDVPPAILYGSRDDVVLDCDFDSGGDTVTDLKWFLNGDTLIYQWLPIENKGIQPNPNFEKHIDKNYKVTKNGSVIYRALHITNLTLDFTGNYTCKVSSVESEDEKTKRMIIYVIPDDTDDLDTDNDYDNIDDDDDVLEVTISKETKEITCSASGFFPEPNLTLYITNDNNTEILFRQDDEILELTEWEYYNVTSTLQFEAKNLTQIFNYVCQLNIPGTPYNISEEGTFSLENSSPKQLASLLPTAVMMLLLSLLNF